MDVAKGGIHKLTESGPKQGEGGCASAQSSPCPHEPRAGCQPEISSGETEREQRPHGEFIPYSPCLNGGGSITVSRSGGVNVLEKQPDVIANFLNAQALL